ncbi:polysaccharide deacetylase family protein [Aquabacterium sp.]|uniref:polysaccharide deacetylase family protein n=1 Tax=Aquabacterium sp. TaxID=1872578 RepID=UPI0035B264F0
MSGPRRWRPTPLLALSLAVHALTLPAVAWHPAWWPGALTIVLLDHLLLMVVGLWPRSTGLGPNLVRLPAAAVARHEVAITIDDGPHPDVTPAVLAVLAAKGVHATFFCIGQQAQAHPDVCRAIVSAGHDLQNHGQRHPTLAALMGPVGWRREIEDGARTLAAITGRRPTFYRAVAGLRNPFLDPVLHQLGLRLASWTRRGFDTRTGAPDTVLKRLLRNAAAGDVLLLHDGHAARAPDGRPVIVAVLPRLIDELHARGLRPVTLSHACAPN